MARRLSRAQRIGKLLERRAIALSEKQLNLLPSSDLIIITTPDDLIDSIAHKLAETQNGMRGPRTVLHTSGALAADVLAPLRRAGFAAGSLHPLVSISESRLGAELLTNAFFSVEGDQAAVSVAKSIVSDLGGESFKIDSRCKALYHAAANFSGAFVIALIQETIALWGKLGIAETDALAALLPLLRGTADNVEKLGAAGGLGSAIARGDAGTLRKHLDVLAREAPHSLELYRILSLRTIPLALEKGTLKPEAAKEITALLNSGKSVGSEK